MKMNLIGTLLLVIVTLSPQCFADPAVWIESYTLEQKGEYDKAADILKPLTKEPESAEFAIMRTAWLNYLNGNHGQSILNYRKSIKTNEESIEARVAILSPLAAQHRWKEVAVIATEVLDLSPWNYQAHLFLMQSRNNAGDWGKLKEQAINLTVKYPSSIDPWVFLARAHHHERHLEEAVKAYQQVLRRYPSNIEANIYLKESLE